MRALIIIAALGVTSALRAQGPAAPPQARADAAAVADRAAVDPTLRSTGRGTAPAIALQFLSDESTATAQVGGGAGTAQRWGLTVSGPLSKNAERTTLATGEGLNSGFNAELLLRQVTLSSAPPIPAREFAALCERYARPERSEQVRTTCTRGDLTREGQRLLDARAFQPVWTYGGSFKVGRSTFGYTDPASFTDQSETHDGWSAAVSVGRFQSGRLAAALYYVGASYRHEDAFVGNGPRNVCTPIGTSTSMFCRDIAIGAPRRRTSDLVQLEARSFLGENLGLAPRVTLDANEGEWAVDVPAYLRSIEGPFNGGVSIGWDSERSDFVLSLFVGALPRILQ